MHCALPYHLYHLLSVANSNNPQNLPLSRTQILSVMGFTAVILLLVAKLWEKFGSVQMLPLKFTTDAFVLGIAIAGGITIASSIVYRLWPAYRHSADYYLELILKPLLWPDLIWLGLLPGLSEELLFRGVMLSAFGLNWIALIVSSIAFGVAHFSGSGQWPYVVWATIVGLGLGYSAIATGNLLIPIVAHIITNCLSSSLWKAKIKFDFPSS